MFSSDHGDEGRMPVDDGAELMTLEGTLYYKKGGRGRPFKWKRRFVRLDMADGGSISCFKAKDEGAKKMLRQMYTTLNLSDEKAGKATDERGRYLLAVSYLIFHGLSKTCTMIRECLPLRFPQARMRLTKCCSRRSDDDEDESIATEMSSSAVHH